LTRKVSKLKATRLPSRGWLIAIIVVAGAAAYFNSFDVPLVFDDLLTIQKNPAVRFGQFDWNLINPRSVLYLTFTLNHVLSGQEVWSYHFINLILHLLNGVLVFLFAEHLIGRVIADVGRTRYYAAAAAAFFVLHPIQTESVTYISSRSELLSATFYLCGVLLFIKWPWSKTGFLASLAVSVPFFFALGAKEVAISLPATLFLYDWLFMSSGDFRPILGRWRFYVLFIIGGVTAAFYILTVNLRESVGAGLPDHLTTYQYFLTQLKVITRYVFLTLVPIGQNLDHDIRASNSPLEIPVLASALLLVALMIFAWRIRKRFPVFSFSIFWFFLTLAPTSSVVPILDVIFEHRLYYPMMGVCLSFPMAMLLLEPYGNRVRIRLTANSLMTIGLGVLLVLTVLRNHIWRDEVRLWTDVVAKSPHKLRPQNSLAWAHYKKGQYAEAIDVIQSAMPRVTDRKAELMTDILGNLYLQTQRYDEAIEVYKRTVGDADHRRAALEYNNLGVAHLYKWEKLQANRGSMSDAVFLERKKEILGEASSAFRRSIDLDSGLFSALDSYVNVSYYLGLHAELESQALERLKTNARFNDLYILGKLAFLAEPPNFARADEFFERAERLKSDEKLIYFNHGYALDELDQKDRAIQKYLHAIRIDPIFGYAHHNLALIYMDKADYPKAIEHFLEVLRYDPNHLQTNLNLAKISGILGQKQQARKYLQTVLNAHPGNQQAMQIWQQLGL